MPSERFMPFLILTNHTATSHGDRWAISFPAMKELLKQVDKATQPKIEAVLRANGEMIQPLLHNPWQPRDIGNGFIFWRAAAVDPPSYGSQVFYFSIEEIIVDRLVKSSLLQPLSS
jgi:hypothetical protein